MLDSRCCFVRRLETKKTYVYHDFMHRGNMPPFDVRSLFAALLEATPGDREVTDLVVGAFSVGCVSRRLGLASLARPPLPEHAFRPVQEAGRLLPCSARTLATRLFDGSVLEASIAVAALNSLIEPPLSRCQELNAALLLAQRGEGRHMAVVGHFPFVERLRGIARHLDVFELPEGLREGDLDIELLPERLPRADVVAVTGTTLTNQTLSTILEHVRTDAFVVLIGASAPLSPALFEYGIDAICGAHALDVAATMAALSQGATYRQLSAVQRLTLLRH
jgi:hypothetical protein